MNTKINLIAFALIGTVIGYIVSHPLLFHICTNTYIFKDEVGCIDSSIKEVGFPLYIFSLGVLLTTAIAAAFSEQIFNSWVKVAAVMLPLAFIFIVMTPVTYSGISLNLFPFYRDDAARLAAEVFTAVSLIYLLWKYFSTRGK